MCYSLCILDVCTTYLLNRIFVQVTKCKVLTKSIILILVLGLVTTSQFAFADGNDSPPECLGGLKDDTGGPTTIDVGVGNTITGICIKSGNEAFDEWKHSGLITEDGTVGDGYISNDCFMIVGIGTKTVIVTETGNVDCNAISHVDYIAYLGYMIGGESIPIDTTMVLLAGSQMTAAWMIPVIVAGIGIGIVIARKF